MALPVGSDEIIPSFHPTSLLTQEQELLLDSLNDARLGGKPERNQFKKVLQATNKKDVENLLKAIKISLPCQKETLELVAPECKNKNPKKSLRLLANPEFFISTENIFKKREIIPYFNVPPILHFSREEEQYGDEEKENQ
jgi:hypothetical protein